VLYYNGPAVPTDGSGGGPLPGSDTWAGPDAAGQDASPPSCDPPDASSEPSWSLVGDPGVSAGETGVFSLAADAVVTFDGTKWVPVGDASAYLLLADAPVVHVSADRVPYLAFCDHMAGARLSVIAYR
jgi:hypothetical protein